MICIRIIGWESYCPSGWIGIETKSAPDKYCGRTGEKGSKKHDRLLQWKFSVNLTCEILECLLQAAHSKQP